jgi:hypothetical protein
MGQIKLALAGNDQSGKPDHQFEKRVFFGVPGRWAFIEIN